MVTRADGMDNPNVVPFGGDLAEALTRAGEIGRASEILAWLEERAEATGLRFPRIVAARGRAVIEEDPSAAQEWFLRALSACDGSSMPFEQARTLLCQGESLRRARRPAAAREPLRHALMIFRSLGAQPWITRTATELGAAGVRGSAGDRPGDRTRLDELTPQELQIARAVGRGLNNVEAAAALFVSRKTVEAHLTRAYRKLGVRSRTELTRVLLAHDASD
jgi:DNA-binding CsgD family transcriptional regulator